jgi:serine/threonine protein phosphatase PrpC
MNNKPLWMIGAASVRGQGHVKIDLPNQDAYEVAMSRDGNSVAAVVSDGAGSALRAGEGASACVKIMIRCLLDIGEKHRDAVAGALNHKACDQKFIQERITQGLQEVRNFLDSTGQGLQDFHHTFTGTVLTPTGGIVAQIGDSPAIITLAEIVLDATGKHKEVDFFAKHEVFTPEKGEYANETSFVTQPNWLTNLRYIPFHSDSQRAVLLMSDGAGELAISKGRAFRPFIGTMIHKMINADTRQERDQILHENLAHPQADALTADDKTLVILCHRDWKKLAAQPHVEEPELDEPCPDQESLSQLSRPPECQGSVHNALNSVTSILTGHHKGEQRSIVYNLMRYLPILPFVLGAVVISVYFLTRGKAEQAPPHPVIMTPSASTIDRTPQHTTGDMVVPVESTNTAEKILPSEKEKIPLVTKENPSANPSANPSENSHETQKKPKERSYSWLPSWTFPPKPTPTVLSPDKQSETENTDSFSKKPVGK